MLKRRLIYLLLVCSLFLGCGSNQIKNKDSKIPVNTKEENLGENPNKMADIDISKNFLITKDLLNIYNLNIICESAELEGKVTHFKIRVSNPSFIQGGSGRQKVYFELQFSGGAPNLYQIVSGKVYDDNDVSITSSLPTYYYFDINAGFIIAEDGLKGSISKEAFPPEDGYAYLKIKSWHQDTSYEDAKINFVPICKKSVIEEYLGDFGE